jgi:hypothetical protein
MGQIVTVKKQLYRSENTSNMKWTPLSSNWVGWIVGFTFKQDGYRTFDNYEDGGASHFNETGRQLCVLVKPWPTMKARPVALDGYEMGGTPKPPDHGGWRAYKKQEAMK